MAHSYTKNYFPLLTLKNQWTVRSHRTFIFLSGICGPWSSNLVCLDCLLTPKHQADLQRVSPNSPFPSAYLTREDLCSSCLSLIAGPWSIYHEDTVCILTDTKLTFREGPNVLINLCITTSGTLSKICIEYKKYFRTKGVNIFH